VLALDLFAEGLECLFRSGCFCNVRIIEVLVEDERIADFFGDCLDAIAVTGDFSGSCRERLTAVLRLAQALKIRDRSDSVFPVKVYPTNVLVEFGFEDIDWIDEFLHRSDVGFRPAEVLHRFKPTLAGDEEGFTVFNSDDWRMEKANAGD